MSKIIESFNEECKKLFDDPDLVTKGITDSVAPKVAADPAYQNAKLNTPQAARLEHDHALEKAMFGVLNSNVDLYKQFATNPSFKRLVTDMV